MLWGFQCVSWVYWGCPTRPDPLFYTLDWSAWNMLKFPPTLKTFFHLFIMFLYCSGPEGTSGSRKTAESKVPRLQKHTEEHPGQIEDGQEPGEMSSHLTSGPEFDAFGFQSVTLSSPRDSWAGLQHPKASYLTPCLVLSGRSWSQSSSEKTPGAKGPSELQPQGPDCSLQVSQPGHPR